MIKNRVSIILTIFFIVLFALYLFNNFESLKTLNSVSLWVPAFIAITKLVKFFINGLFIQWTVEVFTEKFKLREALYISIMSAVGNFFGPLMGGAAIRAVYLKKIHKLPYSSFASTLTGYYVILFGMTSLLGASSLLLLSDAPKRSVLFLFFVVWFIFMLFMIFLKLPSRTKFKSLEANRIFKNTADIVYKMEEGWMTIVRNKILLLKLSLLGIAGLLLAAITTFVEFKAIGASISLQAIGLHTALSASAILISITPGAIGVKEGILVFGASVMNVTVEQVLLVSIIDRSMTFVVLAALSLVSSRIKKGKGDHQNV